MKVRMIEGGYEDPEPGLDYFLSEVAFPMEVTDPRDDEEIHASAGICERDRSGGYRILRSEEELEEWARSRFLGLNIWEMEVSAAAVVKEDLPLPDAAREAAENIARAIVALYPYRASLGQEREALDAIRDELLSVADREEHPEGGGTP